MYHSKGILPIPDKGTMDTSRKEKKMVLQSIFGKMVAILSMEEGKALITTKTEKDLKLETQSKPSSDMSVGTAIKNFIMGIVIS